MRRPFGPFHRGTARALSDPGATCRISRLAPVGRLWLVGVVACASIATATAQEVVRVDAARHYQTMTGWEAHARSWEIDKRANAYDPTFKTHAAALAERMVNELGINRLQLSLKTGWMNPVDYWTQFVDGRLSYKQWGRHQYEKVAGATLQYAEFDFNVETMLMPMWRQMQARGERLYVNMIGTDFNVPGMNGNFAFSRNPEAFAKFAVAYAQRLRTRYGITLDAFEVILEPENSDPANPWRGPQIGAALVALRAAFDAAGFPGIELIAPSVTDAANTIPYLRGIETVPGAIEALDTVAYHRYKPGDYAGIHAYARSLGKRTAMAEWWRATIDTLYDDLTLGQVSSWQKWSVAGRKGGSLNGYYVADLGGREPAFAFAPNVAPMALVFPYVRLGAVRIEAQSASMRVLAFANPDGTEMVFAMRERATGTAPVTVRGLRPGTYGVRTLAAGATEAVDGADATVADDGSVTVVLPAGYATLYGKATESHRPAQPPAARR